MSIEFGGYRPEAEKSRPEVSNEITDLTINWDSKLSHISSNTELRSLFLQATKVAKAKVLEDKDVVTRFKDLIKDLENDDDEDINRETLSNFIEDESAGEDDLDDEDDADEFDDEDDI